MRTRVISLAIGGLLCGTLGFLWARTHRETRAFIAARTAIEASQAEMERRAADLQAEIAVTTAEIARTRVTVAAALPAAERARAAVGPLIARIKQEHAINPPPVRPPPPPSGPSGSVFPELMGDPEYNRANAVLVRSWVEMEHRALLIKLGVSRDVTEQVVDILTERQLVAQDRRSLMDSGNQPRRDAITAAASFASRASEQKEQEETDNTIHQLLGDENYNRFAEDIVEQRITSNGNGPPTVERVTRRGVPDYRSPNVFEGQPLELRLSYSPAPLTEEQKTTLGDWMKKNNASYYNLWRSQPLTDQVRATLRPDQQFALDELYAEYDAGQKRGKLPNVGATPAKAKPSK